MNVKIGDDWNDDRAEIAGELRAFCTAMRSAPFQNEQGLRGVSAFALYYFLRKVRPTIVFEVGVWRGFCTWLIEQAAPEAEIHCFDPIFMMDVFFDPSKIGQRYFTKRAHYSAQDFSCADIAGLAAGHARPLAFFDDHQNKLPRLMQARAAGLREIVFDDNIAQLQTHRTLEDERAEAAGQARLDAMIDRCEIFPALWPFELAYGGRVYRENGIGFSVEKVFEPVYRDRAWHSYVTYVRLKADAAERPTHPASAEDKQDKMTISRRIEHLSD